VNALGVSTLVTDYVPRSRPQWGGQRPTGPPVAIETSQSIKNRPLHCRQEGCMYRWETGDAVGDEVHKHGYSRMEKKGALEPKVETAGSSDGTGRHNP